MFHMLSICMCIMIQRRNEVTNHAFKDLYRCLGKTENNFLFFFFADFDIYTHASTVCLRGRCASYRVAVTLSPCRTVKVGISAHRPQHILCLKTDTKLTSSLSVLDAVADIQWKNSALCSRVLETFSVAEVYDSQQ